MGEYLTQRVTAKDIERGQIRIPITNGAKAAFPQSRAQVAIRLRGRDMEVGYDPHYDPDQERSGVLRIGKAEMSSGVVGVDERLRITPGPRISLD